MSPVGGMWAPAALRVLRKAVLTSTKLVRTQLAAATRPLRSELQPVAVRSSPGGARQPVHPTAFLRQQKRGKWFSTASFIDSHAAVRRYLSTGASPGGPRFVRFELPVSKTSRAVSQLPGRAPFASTLRPNLTGGALPRTAGGYTASGTGRVGGRRYFSHTPAAPAQVVQNVSQAMRAFWLSGQRARFDGVDSNGKARYRPMSAAEEDARARLATGVHPLTPGSYVEFRTNPTITALSPFAPTFSDNKKAVFTWPEPAVISTLNTEGFLDVLSVDFARALRDLAAVMTDLRRLADLGDLPITLEKENILRVRFPGVDAAMLERLCNDIGVQRGRVGQDPGFDSSVGGALALRFPFAPDGLDDEGTKTITSHGSLARSHDSGFSIEGDAFFDEFEQNPWVSSPRTEENESMSPPIFSNSGEHCSEDFEGLEGIYRFIEECDRVRDCL